MLGTLAAPCLNSFVRRMSTALFQAAVHLYCENPSHVVANRMADVLSSELTVSRDDAESALREARELIEFCIREIHGCYLKSLGSEEPARVALQAKRADLDSRLVSIIHRYSSWCVAKGA